MYIHIYIYIYTHYTHTQGWHGEAWSWGVHEGHAQGEACEEYHLSSITMCIIMCIIIIIIIINIMIINIIITIIIIIIIIISSSSSETVMHSSRTCMTFWADPATSPVQESACSKHRRQYAPYCPCISTILVERELMRLHSSPADRRAKRVHEWPTVTPAFRFAVNASWCWLTTFLFAAMGPWGYISVVALGKTPKGVPWGTRPGADPGVVMHCGSQPMLYSSYASRSRLTVLDKATLGTRCLSVPSWSHFCQLVFMIELLW